MGSFRGLLKGIKLGVELRGQYERNRYTRELTESARADRQNKYPTEDPNYDPNRSALNGSGGSSKIGSGGGTKIASADTKIDTTTTSSTDKGDDIGGSGGSDTLVGSRGNDDLKGGGGAIGGGHRIADVTAYIREAAKKRGIDPEIAVRVARSEGLRDGVWQSNVVGKNGREKSYGPYQMLIGGMGSEFEQATGLKVSDPKNVYPMIDFALDQAVKGGWHPWYGAAKVGVGNWDGLQGGRTAGINSSPTSGGDEGGDDLSDGTPPPPPPGAVERGVLPDSGDDLDGGGGSETASAQLKIDSPNVSFDTGQPFEIAGMDSSWARPVRARDDTLYAASGGAIPDFTGGSGMTTDDSGTDTSSKNSSFGWGAILGNSGLPQGGKPTDVGLGGEGDWGQKGGFANADYGSGPAPQEGWFNRDSADAQAAQRARLERTRLSAVQRAGAANVLKNQKQAAIDEAARQKALAAAQAKAVADAKAKADAAAKAKAAAVVKPAVKPAVKPVAGKPLVATPNPVVMTGTSPIPLTEKAPVNTRWKLNIAPGTIMNHDQVRAMKLMNEAKKWGVELTPAQVNRYLGMGIILDTTKPYPTGAAGALAASQSGGFGGGGSSHGGGGYEHGGPVHMFENGGAIPDTADNAVMGFAKGGDTGSLFNGYFKPRQRVERPDRDELFKKLLAEEQRRGGGGGAIENARDRAARRLSRIEGGPSSTAYAPGHGGGRKAAPAGGGRREKGVPIPTPRPDPGTTKSIKPEIADPHTNVTREPGIGSGYPTPKPVDRIGSGIPTPAPREPGIGSGIPTPATNPNRTKDDLLVSPPTRSPTSEPNSPPSPNPLTGKPDNVGAGPVYNDPLGAIPEPETPEPGPTDTSMVDPSLLPGPTLSDDTMVAGAVSNLPYQNPDSMVGGAQERVRRYHRQQARLQPPDNVGVNVPDSLKGRSPTPARPSPTPPAGATPAAPGTTAPAAVTPAVAPARPRTGASLAGVDAPGLRSRFGNNKDISAALGGDTSTQDVVPAVEPAIPDPEPVVPPVAATGVTAPEPGTTPTMEQAKYLRVMRRELDSGRAPSAIASMLTQLGVPENLWVLLGPDMAPYSTPGPDAAEEEPAVRRRWRPESVGMEEVPGFARGGAIPDPNDGGTGGSMFAGLDVEAAGHGKTVPLQSTPKLRNDVAKASYDGLQFLKREFGLAGEGAVPTPDDSAIRSQGARRMASGEGAADPEEVANLDRQFDPQGQLTGNDAEVHRLAAIHAWFLEHGQADKAAAVAASLMQYGAQRTQQIGAVAAGAYSKYQQTGDPKDLDAVAGLLEKAYEMIPNNSSAQIELSPDGKSLQVDHIDADGNHYSQEIAPNEIPKYLELAMTGQGYWAEIAKQADPKGYQSKLDEGRQVREGQRGEQRQIREGDRAAERERVQAYRDRGWSLEDAKRKVQEEIDKEGRGAVEEDRRHKIVRGETEADAKTARKEKLDDVAAAAELENRQALRDAAIEIAKKANTPAEDKLNPVLFDDFVNKAKQAKAIYDKEQTPEAKAIMDAFVGAAYRVSGHDASRLEALGFTLADTDTSAQIPPEAGAEQRVDPDTKQPRWGKMVDDKWVWINETP